MPAAGDDATKFVAPGTLHHARLDVGGAAVVYYAVGDAANASAPRSPTYATAGGGGRPAQYPFALLAVGDVGTQWPEARNTTARMAEAAAEGGVGLVAHVGDISYATGHSSQWADFMQAIEPLAAVVPYHTTAGNHDTLCELGAGFDTAACKGLGGWIPPEDWIGYLEAGGAGGECGVPYDVRFWMPPPTSVTATATVRRRQGAPRAALVAPRSFPTTADTGQAVQTGSSSPGSDPARGNLYHSVEQGPVHMAFISSEHNVSAQLGWLDADLATVNRERTPFVLFAMHRPYYDSTLAALAPYTIAMRNLVEPVLAKHGVDLALHGHVHSYERTCAMLGGKCVDAARGVKYLTVGAGGAPTHAPWLPAPDFIEFRSQRRRGAPTRASPGWTCSTQHTCADALCWRRRERWQTSSTSRRLGPDCRGNWLREQITRMLLSQSIWLIFRLCMSL